MIKGEEVVVYGIRAWDGIGASNIEVYDRRRMVESGIKYSVKEGLKNFSQKELPIWLHFDVDVLDPEFMPGQISASGAFVSCRNHPKPCIKMTEGQFLAIY